MPDATTLGPVDLQVSGALYVSDPDGLGIEIGADRPFATWHYRSATCNGTAYERWENGEIVEENLFYDVVGLMSQIGVG